MRDTPSFATIFDMDGVLVDSEPLQIRAYVQAWSEFGAELTAEEMIERVVNGGMRIQALFELHGGDPADWDALFRRKTEIYGDLVRRELRPMPGALDLLRDLKANGIPRALATSAARVSMDLVFDAVGLAPYFDATVTFDDVTNHKPDPEVFLKAAALLDVPPHRCVVIEDAAKGVAAARAAGMRCVVVLTPLTQPDGLAGADLVVGSLEELTTHRLAALAGLQREEDNHPSCRRGG